MLYFYLGLASIACCIIQGIIYGWFASSQDNVLHNIVDLWTKDPIEKAFFVSMDAICPEGTSEENITFNYDGKSGLCVCEESNDEYSDDRYLKGTRKPSNSPKTNTTPTPKVPTECSSLYCSSGQEKITKVDPIPSETLHNFFSGQKVCTSRISGYSFAKQAPEKQECDSDEIYCSWNSKNQSFDIDHGYCTPKDRECFRGGVQVPQKQENISQLPLVGFSFSETQNTEYNIISNRSSVNEKQLLEINQVSYPSEYQSQLTKTFFFQNIYMPRVKARCRASLKDTLSHYIGPSGAKSISLASMIISVFTAVIIFFFAGIGDICDLKNCEKNKCNCESYCQAKRVSAKHSKIRNTLYVVKPILLVTMLILNIIIVKNYISILNEMSYMIKDGCLDKYVESAVGYGYIFGSSFYDTSLTYASIGLIAANLLFDQNVYYLIKTFILIIFCQQKCTCQKKQETPNQVKTSPETSCQKDSLKNNEIKQENLQTQNGIQSYPILNNNTNTNFDIKSEQNKLFSHFNNKEKDDKNININDNKKEECYSLNNSENGNINKIKNSKFEQKNNAMSKRIQVLEEQLKYRNLNEQQIKKINETIQKQLEKQNKLQKEEKEIVKSENKIFKNTSDNQEFGSIFNQININHEKQKTDYQSNLQNNHIIGDANEFVKFNKYNTKEFVQPPDAPAPPEQSEQLNNSVRDDDIFSQK